jgi:uncharacterized protein
MSLLQQVLAGKLLEVRQLLENRAFVDSRDGSGRTPLMHAVIEENTEMARLLLEYGANPNVQDASGCGALHFAAQKHNPEMVEMIIGEGGVVDLEDMHGNTPLARAVFESRGRMEVITILLRAGADKLARNRHGVSPLDLARSIANFKIEL